jgi:hypothetical protein
MTSGPTGSSSPPQRRPVRAVASLLHAHFQLQSIVVFYLHRRQACGGINAKEMSSRDIIICIHGTVPTYASYVELNDNLRQQLIFSVFKTLTDQQVTVELKNDLSITGVLKSVDQSVDHRTTSAESFGTDSFPDS